MKNLYLLIAAIFLTPSVIAQSPEKMSYQAVVRNAENAPIANQAVGMQISILQGSASSTAVYVEVHTPMTNNHGLVSLSIGEGTVVTGTFSTIDWSAGPYFIKTETDPAGGENYTITGTSQLLSVPYALHAKTAENFINDQVDDADADPTNELQNLSLSGTTLNISDGMGVSLDAIIPPGGTDDQTAAEVNYNNGTSGLIAENVQNAIDELASNSTINTDNQELDFNNTNNTLSIDRGNTVDLSDLATGADDWGEQVVVHDNSIKGDGTTGNPIGLAQQGATNDQVLKWNGSAWMPGDDAEGSGGSLWTESGDNVYYNNGRVGVGITNPVAPLHVGLGNFASSAIRLESTGNYSFMSFYNSEGFQGQIGIIAGLMTLDSYNHWHFRTNSDTKMVIANDGDIGIGTMAPEASLHVRSTENEVLRVQNELDEVRIDFHNNAGNIGYVGSNFRTNIDMGTTSGNTTGYVRLRTQNISRFAIGPNGNVGVGVLSPDVKLDVRGGQWDVTNTEGDFRIGNSVNRLKIGVATGGGGAGIARIRAVGNVNQLRLGAGSSDVVIVEEDRIEINGEVNTSSTGTANMVPIAYGYVTAGGTVGHGSGNWSVTRVSEGVYSISISDETFAPSTHIAIVSKIGASGGIGWGSNGGNLTVTSVNSSNSLSDANLSFVVYKP